MFTFGSLFAGIGGFELGFERAGMNCLWQVENDRHCNSVLECHWPDIQRYGDVHDVGRHNLGTVDLICGGFPCQDVSVAGKRKGLAGKRSGLWFEFYRVLEELTPKWVVVENVPGLLSSNGGRDFAVILQGLVEIGYGVVWRVFDAQYFGVAQRRRRVFIVGHLGDGRAAEVLLEREGGCWHPPPGREAGKGTAGTLEARTRGGGFPGTDGAAARHVVSAPIAAKWHKGTGGPSGDEAQNLVIGFDRGRSTVSGDIAGPLRVQGSVTPGVNPGKPDSQCIAYGVSENQRAEIRLTDYSRQITSGGGKPGQGYPCVAFANVSDGSAARTAKGLAPPITNTHGDPGCVAWHENKQGALTPDSGGIAKAIRAGASHSYQGVGVRRLTPVECERLQAFPDGWTAGQSDTQRYRQLGNAVCVNVAEWIGRRIVNCPA